MDKIKALVDYDDDEDMSSDDCPIKQLPESRFNVSDMERCSQANKKETAISRSDETASSNSKHQSSKYNELNNPDKLDHQDSSRSCSIKSEHRDLHSFTGDDQHKKTQHNVSHSSDSHKIRKKHSNEHRESNQHQSKKRERSRSKERSRSRERKTRERNRSRERKRKRSRSRSRSRERQRKDSKRDSKRRSEERLEKSRSRDKRLEKRNEEVRRPVDSKKLTGTSKSFIEQTKDVTGISVPKYYNAAVVNSLKLAEQEKKRKLLWGDSNSETSSKNSSSSVWQNLTFGGDQGNAMTEKFRKLMGIKDKGQTCDQLSSVSDGDLKETKPQQDILENQSKLFRNLDMQYSVARMSTHTHRGVGLGFTTSSNYLPAKQK